MSEVIGIMEGAFFVSRQEIIQWVNETYLLNVSKIEQFGSGAIYCQIFDSIHPGKINMSKVHWRAQLEYDFINNFKLLQQAFLKCHLNKHIEIERLVKAKYQDNLEFAQWMKRYYDLNNGGSKDYDPVEKRFGQVPDFAFGDKQIPSVAAKQGHVTQPRKNNHKPAEEKHTVSSTHVGRKKEKQSTISPQVREVKGGSQPMRKRLDSDENKQIVNDTRSLYQYLLAMKDTLTDSKAENQEKMKKVYDLVNASLKNNLFDGERRREKAAPKPMKQINEDEKELIGVL